MMFARAVVRAQAAATTTATRGERLTHVVARATSGGAGRREHLGRYRSGRRRAEGRIPRIRGGDGAVVIRHLSAGAVPPSSSSLPGEKTAAASAGHDDGGPTPPSDGGRSRVGVEEGGDDGVTGWDEKRRIREEMVSLAEGAGGGGGVDPNYSPADDEHGAASIVDGGHGTNNRIPLQSPEMAMLLFDALAPHLEKRHLRSLSVRLSKFASSHSADVSDDSGDGGDDVDPFSAEGRGSGGSSGSGSGALRRSRSKQRIHNGLTLVYQLNEYFSSGDGGKGGKKKNAHHANNSNPWVRPLLCHFLVGYDISGHAGSAGISSSTAPMSAVDDSVSADDDSAPSSQSSSVGDSGGAERTVTTRNANVWDDPTFPPNANRLSWDGDVSTLLAARETSASGPDGPPSWRGNRRRRRRGGKESPNSDADAREMDESPSQLRSRAQSRADAVRAIHSTKSEGRRRAEAEEMASLLADRLPRATHEKLMAFLSEYAASADDGCGGEDGLGEERDGHGREEGRKTKKNRPMRNLGRRLRHVLGFHMPLVATQLAEFLYVLDVPPSSSSPPHRGDDCGDGDDDDDRMMVEAWEEWNDARSTLVDAFLSSQAEYARRPPVRVDTTAVEERQRIVERVTETIAGLNALRADADADGISVDSPPGGATATAAVRERDPSDLTLRRGPKPSASSRRRRAVHIVFDALMLSDERTRQIRSENETVANRRRVFINNLPVDVTEEEVRALYGRCGPIERVTVHNLRPDLDPGALTKKEVAELRRRRKGAFRRGVRRTPVYAVVDFETEGGYDVATGDNLTVFGMVVRKHPVRSIPASRLTNLFIENIPQGHYSMDLEYKISKALHPEIYVCLDVGDHDYSEPHSCEIKFPSHEIASFAYERLRHLDMGSDDCVVNWMRTPEDAEEYWTRELGFDG